MGCAAACELKVAEFQINTVWWGVQLIVGFTLALEFSSLTLLKPQGLMDPSVIIDSALFSPWGFR